MSIRTKAGAVVAAAGVAVCFVAMVSSPSYAAEGAIASAGQGHASGQVAVTADGYADTPVVRKLKSLVGTQTPEEIEQIQEQGSTGADVQVLSASDGTAIAAYVAATPEFSPLVSPVGPGCSTTSACVKTKQGVPYGYTGQGQINANIKNATSGFAGRDGYDTGFWTGNTIHLARQGTTLNLASSTVTSITRTPAK